MTLTKADIAEIEARRKIRAADAQALGYDERRQAQQERAAVIAHQLAGKNPSRSLVRGLLELVEADEKPDPPVVRSSGRAHGSRRVLKPKKVVQESLW
jgi:hypothetical protein